MQECAAQGVMMGDTISESAHVLATALALSPGNIKLVSLLACTHSRVGPSAWTASLLPKQLGEQGGGS